MEFPAGSDTDRRKVTGQDVTISSHDTIVDDYTNDVRSGGTLPMIAVALLALASAVVGILLLVSAFGAMWTFWPRVGLSFLGSWFLACAVTLIATRSSETSGAASYRHLHHATV